MRGVGERHSSAGRLLPRHDHRGRWLRRDEQKSPFENREASVNDQNAEGLALAQAPAHPGGPVASEMDMCKHSMISIGKGTTSVELA